MLVKTRTKHFSNICKVMTIILTSTSFALYKSSIENVNAQQILDDSKNNDVFFFEFKNGDKLSVSQQETQLVIKRINDQSDVWSTQVEFDNLHFNQAYIVDELGFVVIGDYCNIDNDDSLKENKDLSHQCEINNRHRLFAFNSNGELFLDEDVIDLSKEFLDAFIEDVFMINLNSFKDTLSTMSQEDLYNLSLELLSIAEESLNKEDIEKANLTISNITDESLKNSLMKRLNIISMQSIDEEINNPDSEEPIYHDVDSLSTSSEIILSVATNNIIFDYLNVSEDTVLYRAIDLDVTSTLPYDINMYIEGDIVSNTNPKNLNNNVFSVKESSSTDFLTFDETGAISVLSNIPAGVANSYGIDIRLNTSTNIIRDVYRAVFKIEAVTK